MKGTHAVSDICEENAFELTQSQLKFHTHTCDRFQNDFSVNIRPAARRSYVRSALKPQHERCIVCVHAKNHSTSILLAERVLICVKEFEDFEFHHIV